MLRNHPEHLDPALRRAGRFDVQIPFYHATLQQASDLFKHFYPIPESTEETTDGSDEKKQIVTPAELDDLASEFADGIFPKSTDVAKANSEDAMVGSGISMAALQGYLLGHKDEPMAAIQGARAWAAGHSEEKVSRKIIALTPVPAKKPKTVKKKAKVVPKLETTAEGNADEVKDD
jgi:chaperone BCS1